MISEIPFSHKDEIVKGFGLGQTLIYIRQNLRQEGLSQMAKNDEDIFHSTENELLCLSPLVAIN